MHVRSSSSMAVSLVVGYEEASFTWKWALGHYSKTRQAPPPASSDVTLINIIIPGHTFPQTLFNISRIYAVSNIPNLSLMPRNSDHSMWFFCSFMPLLPPHKQQATNTSVKSQQRSNFLIAKGFLLLENYISLLMKTGSCSDTQQAQDRASLVLYESQFTSCDLGK